MGIALAVPISAFAAQTSDVLNAGAGLASASVDASGVEVSAEGDAASDAAAPFDVEAFKRAQKGSNRAIEDTYRGYAYLQGSAVHDVCLVATADYAVLYVSADACAALADKADEATCASWAAAYLERLDAASASGSTSLADGDVVYVTHEETFDVPDAGVRFLFNQEYAEGAFYTSVIGTDGSDVTDAASAAYVELRYADFANVVASGTAAVAAAPEGMTAFKQFLSGLDWSPLWVTLKTTGVAIVIVFFLGILAAWWSLRIPPRAQDIADSIFTIPMVLPPTVCGFVLLLLLGKNTAVGQWFIDIGFPLIFSWPATVLAATVVSFPLMYRSARGAFEGIDRTMLDAARTLGWSEGRIFFRLMLPLAWSSIAAGTVLAFARALGEFGATLFLAGNYVGITRTIPIAIYFEWMNGNTDVALFWTGVIIAFSFLVILFINLWSRRTTRYRKRLQD